MQEFLKRCWANVSLGAIIKNYETAKTLAGDAQVYAVVKANAYGHGAVAVSRALEAAGAQHFAVACLEEALELRAAGVKGEMLILGPSGPMAKLFEEKNITPTVHTLESAKALSRAAVEAGVAPLNVHIKVDTGMSRIGLSSTQDVASVCALPGLFATGIFTHFAVADSFAPEHITYTKKQFALFSAVLGGLKVRGIEIPLAHCANSAAICAYPSMHLDAVRCGISLYGCHPSDEVRYPHIAPTLSLEAVITQVKTIDAGQAVGYGCTFTAEKEMVIATVSAGYADGYPRALSNKGVAAVNGKSAPVIGRVCMDQLMLDVTNCGTVNVGDAACLFGGEGADSVQTAADKAGTIPHELLCGLGKRVLRVYKQTL